MSEADKKFKKLGYEIAETYRHYKYKNEDGFCIKITNNGNVCLYYEYADGLIELTIDEIKAISEKYYEIQKEFKG